MILSVSLLILESGTYGCSHSLFATPTFTSTPCPQQANIVPKIRIQLQRLTATLLRTPALSRRLRGKPLTMLVAEASSPQAYSCNTRIVVLSTKLLESVQRTGELAFIIAHEAAHLALNHTPEPDPSSRRGLRIECEADHVALAAIRDAGFSPQDGVAAILHFEKDRPEALRLRTAALMQEISHTSSKEEGDSELGRSSSS